MLPKTKTERHSDICKEINALYAMKNHDYGDSFHQTFTEEGMAMPRIRLGDKLARFKSLTKSEVQEVKDESIRDTLIDLANYAIMTVLELDDLKAEVVMTANIREWRHFLKLRCSPAAHPQMREVALILLDKVHALIPVCFDDIWSEYHADV